MTIDYIAGETPASAPSAADLRAALVAGLNGFYRTEGGAPLEFLNSVMGALGLFAIGSLVFIVLGVVQIVATGIICIFSRRYRGLVCPYHRAHPYDYDSR